jgi:hypothetical protein
MRRQAKILKVLAIGCLSLAALVLATANAHALEIKRMTLSNGATLLVSEEHQLPMVTMVIAFDAGSRHVRVRGMTPKARPAWRRWRPSASTREPLPSARRLSMRKSTSWEARSR